MNPLKWFKKSTKKEKPSSQIELLEAKRRNENLNRISRMNFLLSQYENTYRQALINTYEQLLESDGGSVLFIPPIFNGGLILACEDEYGRDIDWQDKLKKLKGRISKEVGESYHEKIDEDF